VYWPPTANSPASVLAEIFHFSVCYKLKLKKINNYYWMSLSSHHPEAGLKLNQAGFIRQIVFGGLMVAVALVLAILAINRINAGRSRPAIPQVRSAIAGYCLDDYHDSNEANALVDSWTCNDSAAQDWTVSTNLIEHINQGDKGCLSVQDDGRSQDDKLVLNMCDNGAAQQWTVDLGGFENPASGLCLAIPSGKIKQQLILDSCNNLSQLGEGWVATTWSSPRAPSGPCVTGSEGQQVACYAERQWNAWQSDPSSHQALLTDYTDGNAYEQWCADFVSYVYREAGYPFSAGERDGWDEYDANNVQNMGFVLHPAADYDPSPGDVAFFDYPGGHVEIVETGGRHPTFIYGDSGTTDPATNNGDMNDDGLTSDGAAGQVIYYLSPA
jgi:ricin-type beta-trefoil lectin protein/CHAP domain-containing protein